MKDFWKTDLEECVQYSIKDEYHYDEELGFVHITEMNDRKREYLKGVIEQTEDEDYNELLLALSKNNDSIDNIVGKSKMLIRSQNYRSWTIWTKDYIYFPAMYDGDTWVASVSRTPQEIGIDSVGGG